MKKSIIVASIAAVLLMLVVSCKKENSTSKVVLRAGIESSPAKTYLDIPSTRVKWEKGDRIMVNGNEMLMQGEPLLDGFAADFSCERWKGDAPNGQTQLYAIFPAIDQEQNQDGTWKSKISLPAVQEYIPGGVMHNMPMGISSMSTSLSFHNLTSVLGIPVCTESDNLIITKVVLKQIGGNYPFVGEAWYPHWGTQLEGIEIIGNTSREITMNINGGVKIPKITNPGNGDGIEFFFVVFPVPMEKVEIDFYSGETLVKTIEKPLSGTVEPNTIYDLVETPNPNDRTPWKI